MLSLRPGSGGIALAILSLLSPPAAAQSRDTLILPTGPDTAWWSGVITHGHEMPLRDGYRVDLFADSHGNQVQPLALSSHGEVIWSEDPFRFELSGGEISIVGRSAVTLERAGSTLRDAFLHASRSHFPPSGRMPDSLLFAAPQYNTWIELMYDQNQEDVLLYARSLLANGFPPGVLMIDDNWQEDYGRWTFHPGRFPDPRGMIDELHRLGFEVMVWVCPFVSADSDIYRDLRDRGLLLRDSTMQPALVRWWNGASALVDLSHPEGFAWFTERLDHLVESYGVDGFKLDAGDAEFYRGTLSHGGVSPNEHTEIFGRVGLRYPLNEYRAAWKMGGQPLAQRLRDKTHTWEDLRKLVPHATLEGLMGYPFTAPDLIGGGEISSFWHGGVVDPELLVRSAQAAALMPMMQFSVAPWRILDARHLAAVLKAVDLRQRHTPYILRLAEEAARTGEPIIRSMEYAYPHLGYAAVHDQFMLGDRLLVAPILEKGMTVREVLLPPGRWRDASGRTFPGRRRVRLPVTLDLLPVFERVGG